MKILQIAPYFLPYKGGQEQYIYNLSKHLIKLGHKVQIVTSNHPKGYVEENIDGIPVYRHKCLSRPLRNPITPGMFSLGNIIQDFDIIHAHNEHSFAAFIAAYFRTKVDVPLVLTSHGRLKFGDTLSDRIVNTYEISIGKRILEIVDVICANSINDKEYLSSFNPSFSEKIRIVSNAIDPDTLKNLESISSKSDVIFQQNCRVILFVGRLIRRKGLEWLIKSIDIIINREKKKDILVAIIGSGEDRSYFEKLIAKYNLGSYIFLLGEVSEQRLIYFYKNSDIFVLPSISEVCPTVVLEAMYFSLPVISTDILGIKEHFKDVALLVPPMNEKSLAEAILKMLKDDEFSMTLSKKGEILVKNKYVWELVAKEYENIYIKLRG